MLYEYLVKAAIKFEIFNLLYYTILQSIKY